MTGQASWLGKEAVSLPGYLYPSRQKGKSRQKRMQKVYVMHALLCKVASG